MSVITLSSLDLSLAALLVLAQALLSRRLDLGLERELLVAAARTVVQLSLIGLVLKGLFGLPGWYWLPPAALVMLLLAGREVMARQTRRFGGGYGYRLATGSMLISSFSVTLFALWAVIGVEPWYTPQYAIPLLGMLLGNSMTGIALSLERLTESAWRERERIEARLMLGHAACEAMRPLRREALRGGMMPMINAMAAAGIVSLPGMMTGQILAGTPPLEAVKYQILIMFLISSGTGFGVLAAVHLGARRLFDERQRLRLDRLV